MLMAEHRIVKCEHGTIVAQCRCPAPDKVVTIVDCPDYCPQKGQARS
jgi:hypothetical protein